MNIHQRLKRLEKNTDMDRSLPVLFVEDEDDIQRHESATGSHTVIFLDDIRDKS